MPARDDHPECDFADRPEVCWALKWGNPRPCEQIRAGHCGFRRQIWRATTGEPAPFACPEDPPPSSPVQAHGLLGVAQPRELPPPRTGTVPLAVGLAALKCEHRGRRLPCGCAEGLRECLRDGGGVPFWKCIACKEIEMLPATPSHAAPHQDSPGPA